MEQHKEINHTEIDLAWDSHYESPSYFNNISAIAPHQNDEILNFEFGKETYEFNDRPTVFHSSNESLNSNSSGYHTDNSFHSSSSKYSSTESLYQENDNLNPNIDLSTGSFKNYLHLADVHSSKKSLNSDSSDYYSEHANDYGNRSKDTTKINMENNNINKKNKEPENKKLKNTKKNHKKTHQFNEKLPTTRATALRDNKISNEYKFKLNEKSQKKILNDKKPETKKLDTLMKNTQKTVRELKNLSREISKEEVHIFKLKSKLSLLDNKQLLD